MTVGQDAVHVAHCCGHHGCKYSHGYCPVANQKLRQEYPCPHCLGPTEAHRNVANAQVELAWTLELAKRLGRDDWTSEQW